MIRLLKSFKTEINPKDCLCERHRIKIPTLGWVRLKETGYIPTSKDGYIIKSGTIQMELSIEILIKQHE